MFFSKISGLFVDIGSILTEHAELMVNTKRRVRLASRVTARVGGGGGGFVPPSPTLVNLCGWIVCGCCERGRPYGTGGPRLWRAQEDLTRGIIGGIAAGVLEWADATTGVGAGHSRACIRLSKRAMLR